ncbi:SIMPL domain-containing protein [Marinilongibacter aquaticus]|uniref:SIMPL domain-containing protein n=1 Tax=Marinilongibacter aquaticus TaxID=2975157 RepID=UPI0021BD9124|nr:SIMPL domain-containing protein [Marinilongibacter aquaticus]UBM58110.1 SIMPL domain-containing protein [Marinilongibacter aquaticus]
MHTKNKLFIALGIILGLFLHGLLLGYAIQRFNKEDRSISVKGFSEREVLADQAVWTIKTEATVNDLLDGSKQIESAKKQIVAFLVKNGVKQQEIIQLDLNVTDKLAQAYGSYTGTYRYLVQNKIQVRSSDVQKIQDLSRKTDELLKAGVSISSTNDYRPAIQYLFTGLNDIKPEMLSEATANARKAAEEFTKDGNVELGKLKRASQGLFSIVDRDASASGEGGYASSVNDIYKKVRVVIHVEYSID